MLEKQTILQKGTAFLTVNRVPILRGAIILGMAIVGALVSGLVVSESESEMIESVDMDEDAELEEEDTEE